MATDEFMHSEPEENPSQDPPTDEEVNPPAPDPPTNVPERQAPGRRNKVHIVYYPFQHSAPGATNHSRVIHD